MIVIDSQMVTALAALGAGILGLAALQMRVALRPLRQLEAEISAVRDGMLRDVGPDAPRELIIIGITESGTTDRGEKRCAKCQSWGRVPAVRDRSGPIRRVPHKCGVSVRVSHASVGLPKRAMSEWT